MKLTSILYKLARLSNDAGSLTSFNKAARRGKNKVLGRILGKLGCWNKLW